ncbi:hypothetical protein KL951_001065 [Ogataea haglerorum]|nr:hypothetical protein KL951_001065 [Ogataea haglerorum]
MQVKNRRKVQPSRNAASANENACVAQTESRVHNIKRDVTRQVCCGEAQRYPDSAAAGEELLRCAVPRQDRAIAVFREMASVRRRTAEMQLKNRSDAIARRCRAVI